MPAGEIVITWDAVGHLTVSTPTSDPKLCVTVLTEAIRAIVSGGSSSSIMLPGGRVPEHRTFPGT